MDSTRRENPCFNTHPAPVNDRYLPNEQTQTEFAVEIIFRFEPGFEHEMLIPVMIDGTKTP